MITAASGHHTYDQESGDHYLTLKDGRLISPSVLTHPFKPLTTIEASQIIQKDYDHVVIRLIPKKDFDKAVTAELVTSMKERIGHETNIEIEYVNQLPRTANGKFRWVISEVKLGI